MLAPGSVRLPQLPKKRWGGQQQEAEKTENGKTETKWENRMLKSLKRPGTYSLNPILQKCHLTQRGCCWRDPFNIPANSLLVYLGLDPAFLCSLVLTTQSN